MRVSSWIRHTWYCFLFRGRNFPFLNYEQYLGVLFDGKILWRLPTDTMDAKDYRVFSRAHSVCRIGRPMADVNICPYGTHHVRNNLRLTPLGNSGRRHRLSKLQRLQIKLLRKIDNFPHQRSVWEVLNTWLSKFSKVYYLRTKLCRQQEEVIWNHEKGTVHDNGQGEAQRVLNWPVVMLNTALCNEG